MNKNKILLSLLFSLVIITGIYLFDTLLNQDVSRGATILGAGVLCYFVKMLIDGFKLYKKVDQASKE